MRNASKIAALALLASASSIAAAHADTGGWVYPDMIRVETTALKEIKGLGDLDLKNVQVKAPATEISVALPSEVDSAVEFLQYNEGDISATKNLTTNNISDMVASSTAIGNSDGIEVPGSISIEGVQKNGGNITSSLNTTQTNASGSIDLKSIATANVLNAEAGGDIVFDLNQENTGQVFAELNATINGNNFDDINTSSTAIANSIGLIASGNAVGSSVQRNSGNVTAINNDTIGVMMQPAPDPATAVAIGNIFSLTQK